MCAAGLLWLLLVLVLSPEPQAAAASPNLRLADWTTSCRFFNFHQRCDPAVRWWGDKALLSRAYATPSFDQMAPFLARLDAGQPITVLAMGSSITSDNGGMYHASEAAMAARVSSVGMPLLSRKARHGWLQVVNGVAAASGSACYTRLRHGTQASAFFAPPTPLSSAALLLLLPQPTACLFPLQCRFLWRASTRSGPTRITCW